MKPKGEPLWYLYTNRGYVYGQGAGPERAGKPVVFWAEKTKGTKDAK